MLAVRCVVLSARRQDYVKSIMVKEDGMKSFVEKHGKWRGGVVSKLAAKKGCEAQGGPL